MGLLGGLKKLFGGGEGATGPCPRCAMPGAILDANGEWICARASCGPKPAGTRAAVARPARVAEARPAAGGTEAPAGALPVEIVYRNYRGEELRLSADRRSIWRCGDRVRVTLLPRGTIVSLKVARIVNAPTLGALLDRTMPDPLERQILGYHRKHGSTSPRHEEVRRKYPGW